MTNDSDTPGPLSSPPCFAHELVQGADGYHAVDEQTARDVARWRTAERITLIDKRLELPADVQKQAAQTIARKLDSLIEITRDIRISMYWPYRAEPNLRPWMEKAHQQGACILLPYAPRKNQPLEFRIWTPETKMVRGVLGIPYPADGENTRPDIVIAPLVGCDPDRYRLGYGGGFFDRTLASLTPRPRVIGVGHLTAHIPTIYPQPHDIPMDEIVTA